MVSTTTHSHRVAALALAAVLLLVGAACGRGPVAVPPESTSCPPPPTQPVTPPASGHRAYARMTCGPLPLKVIWHPGETMQYQWFAYPLVPQPDGGDAPVLLTFDVFGPFPSHAAAQAEQLRLDAARMAPGRDLMANPPNTPALPPPPPVVRAPSIITDTWSAQTLTSTIRLPQTLVSGYYVLHLIEVIGESTTPNTQAPNYHTSQTSAIIQVVVP